MVKRFSLNFPGRGLMLRWMALCTIVALALAAAHRAPAAAPTTEREILVPIEELKTLLERPSRRVLLTPEEYADLVRRAAPSPEKPPLPPTPIVLLSAEYTGTIDDQRVVLNGKLEFESLVDELAAVSLPLETFGVQQATLDGRPALLARQDSATCKLFIEGGGRHQLSLILTAPLNVEAARQSFLLQLPRTSATRLRLSVPGNVEIRGGGSVISRRVDEQAGRTQFELLPTGEPSELQMSLNNRQRRTERLVTARGIMLDQLTQAGERLVVRVALEVLHRPVESFEFDVPAGFDVLNVDSPALSRWSLKGGANAPRLEMTLREPTTGMVPVRIECQRRASDAKDWKFPQLAVRDVASQSMVLALVVDQTRKVHQLSTDGLLQLDIGQVLGMFVSDLQVEMGEQALRGVGAWYAPSNDYSLGGEFERPTVELHVATAAQLRVSPGELKLLTALSLQPTVERLFSFDVTLPSGWHAISATDAQKRPLKIHRYAPTAEGARIRLELPQPIEAGNGGQVFIDAQLVPADWLQTWATRKVQLPRLQVAGATRSEGAISVAVADDLAIRPESTTNLLPLDKAQRTEFNLADADAPLAWRFDGDDYQATLIVERLASRATARVINSFRVDPELLSAHYEIIYQIERAGMRRLAIDLPDSTPASVTLRGLDGVVVKEYVSEKVEGKPLRRWVASLAEEHRGRVRVAIEFQEPIGASAKDFSLPLAVAEGVDYQTGLVSIEGHAELDVKIVRHPRRADVGQLAESDYQPGRRLLDVFSYAGQESETAISVTRPAMHRLEEALIERVTYNTLLSASGVSQTLAHLRLRTRQSYLQIELPADSELWTVELEGDSVVPQRQGDRLLLSLPSRGDNAQRQLRVVYETPVAPVAALGKVRLPSLRLLSADGEHEVPAAMALWRVTLPSGYRLIRSTGTLQLVQGETMREELGAWQVASLFQEMPLFRGGTSFRGISNARHAARASRRNEQGYFEFRNGGLAMAVGGDVDHDEADLQDKMLERQWLFDGDDKKASLWADLGEGGVDQFRTTDLAAADAKPQSAAKPAAPVPAKPGLGGAFARLSTTRAPAGAAPAAAAAPAAKAEAAGEVAQAKVAHANRGQAGGGGKIREKAKLSSVSAARSLKIDLGAPGDMVYFESLGVAPELDLTLVDRRHGSTFAWLLGIVVLVRGIAITRHSAREKFRYLAIVTLLATLIPLLTGWFELAAILNGAFYAACLLVPYYALAALKHAVCPSKQAAVRAAVGGAALLVSIIFFAASTAYAEDGVTLKLATPAGGSVQAELVPPVKVPDNATVLLYEKVDEHLQAKPEKVLIPYDRYVELWNKAHPELHREARTLPADYAIGGAEYAASLDDGDSLTVRGTIDLEVFRANKTLEVSLPLADGVLTAALLDGKQARVGVTTISVGDMGKTVATANPATLVVFYIEGAGRHRLELSVRFKVTREGGWRKTNGLLPAVVAGSLRLTAPHARTEVQLTGVPDQGRYKTARDGESFVAALNPASHWHLAWRSQIDDQQVDATLQAESKAVCYVQENGVHVVWQMELQFARQQRDRFSIRVPRDYLVERVSGDNIRGWTRGDGELADRLDVELLQPVADKESLAISLSRQLPLAREAATVEVPAVEAVGSSLHRGDILLYRAAMLDVQVAQTRGVARDDFADDGNANSANNVSAVMQLERSPLGTLPLAHYRFAALPMTIELQTTPLAGHASAEVQGVIKVAERERSLEARITWQITDRPRYVLRAELPGDLEIDQVAADGQHEWAVDRQEGSQRLTVFFAAGVRDAASVIVSGKLGKPGPAAELKLPAIKVLDVERQRGELVVQADPALNIQPEGLVGCQRALLNRFAPWLRPEQRALARLGLTYDEPGYQGNLRIATRTPIIRGSSITNVRFSDRSIQETILINFKIEDSGVREVAFQLPASLRDAQIQVPLLRQKIVEDVGAAPAARVRVRLLLQDAMMNELRLLVTHDRALGGEVYEAPIPTLEIGETTARYVTVENVGRDEVVVDARTGLEALVRGQQQWQEIGRLLGGTTRHAFRVNGAAPRLTLKTVDRAAVETVGARIGLSETDLVCDANGAYRAVQTYRLYNETEPYLEVALPRGASLWTVRVAGEPVKPAAATKQGNVRVPLVKTAVGDLDYTVSLTYGGWLGKLELARRVPFPLMQTVNISVERSNVRLFLPSKYTWYSFDGTLSAVADETVLVSQNETYFSQMVDRVSSAVQSADPFTRARAVDNLSDLQQSYSSGEGLTEYGITKSGAATITLNGGSRSVALDLSGSAIQRGLQMASSANSQQMVSVSNSGTLNNEFTLQKNRNAFNNVQGLGGNFASATATLSGSSNYTGGTTITGGTIVLNGGTLSTPNLSQFGYDMGARNSMLGDRKSGALDFNGKQQSLGAITGTLNLSQFAIPSTPRFESQTNQLGVNQGAVQQKVSSLNLALQGNSAQGQVAVEKAANDKQVQELTENEALGRYQKRLAQQGEQLRAVDGRRDAAGKAAPKERQLAEGRARMEREARGVQGAPATTPSTSEPIAALVSLDVDIPRQGRVYRFTTARGQIQLSAQPVSNSLLIALNRLGLVLAVVALTAWALRRFPTARVQTMWRANSGKITVLLVALGLLGICVLPLIGIALAGTGIAFLLVKFAQSFRSA